MGSTPVLARNSDRNDAEIGAGYGKKGEQGGGVIAWCLYVSELGGGGIGGYGFRIERRLIAHLQFHFYPP